MNRRTPHPAKLSDAVALFVIAFLALAVVVPTLAQVHHSSATHRCREQLGRIGTGAKIYANDNNTEWMVPPFRGDRDRFGGVDYLAGSTVNDPPTHPGEVGYEREYESTSNHPLDPNGGSTALSTTRVFWMLVRSGFVEPQTFVCPLSQDTVDTSPVPESYYDFATYGNISYGYQVPFGPSDTRAREGAHNRQVFAADKGPYYFNTFLPDFEAPDGSALTPESVPGHWRRFNSPNHRGWGQNALFADGHAAFGSTPALGIDGDNIYTLMVDQWDETGFNRIHGESPHFAAAEFPFPGQNAFGDSHNAYSSTDSLIYP